MNRALGLAIALLGISGLAHATNPAGNLTSKTYKTAASAARGAAAFTLDRNSTVQEFLGGPVKASDLRVLKKTGSGAKLTYTIGGLRGSIGPMKVIVQVSKSGKLWRGNKTNAQILNAPDNS
jgi:hypothetical protein